MIKLYYFDLFKATLFDDTKLQCRLPCLVQSMQVQNLDRIMNHVEMCPNIYVKAVRQFFKGYSPVAADVL